MNYGTEQLIAFVTERYTIYQRRRAGLPWPWTNDPILRGWKFCNVYREIDRMTLWLHNNWLKPHAEDPDLFFAAAVARNVNWPETLAEIGYPVPWDPNHFLFVMSARKLRGDQLYSGAYMIRALPAGPGVSKPVYQTSHVFGPLWKCRELLRPQPGDTLEKYHALLESHYGFGSFMAAQVVADLKPYGALESATDWWTFAASGPGSRRGLNRALGRPVSAPWREAEWREALVALKAEVDPVWVWAEEGMPPVDAQNLQNCLCEFDKYERVRLGEGTPKMKFRRPV